MREVGWDEQKLDAPIRSPAAYDGLQPGACSSRAASAANTGCIGNLHPPGGSQSIAPSRISLTYIGSKTYPNPYIDPGPCAFQDTRHAYRGTAHTTSRQADPD